MQEDMTQNNTGSRPEEPTNKEQPPPEPLDQSEGALLDVRDSISNDAAQNTAPNRQEFLDYLSFQRDERIPAGPLHFTDSWMDKMANHSDMKKRPNLDPFTFLGPIATAMPSPARAGGVYSGCPGWERSNRIYSQIGDTSPADASQALALSSAHYADMIFKAVINGWSSLDMGERNNPIMRTLGNIDQVFSKLDPVSRAAFMYKSHMLLKVCVEADANADLRD